MLGKVPGTCLGNSSKVPGGNGVLSGMPRLPRGCFAGRLVETTSRTVQGRFLLRPSREVNAALKGVIARAQQRTDMKIVDVAALSNHIHFLLLPDSTLQMASFMEYFMTNSSKKIGLIQGWKGSVWAKRYKPLIVTNEEPAQIARLKYLLSHGAKEGLVRSPEDWPGLQVVSELCSGSTTVRGGEWHDRSSEYRARLAGHQPKKGEFIERGLEFELTPLPCWSDLNARSRAAAIRTLVDDALSEARISRNGAPVLGPKKVLQQDPKAEPNQTKSTNAPLCHAASRKARLELLSELRDFWDAFLYASQRSREGFEAHFPSGCFPPRRAYCPETLPA